MTITKIAVAAIISSALVATTAVEGASIQQTSEVWTTGAYTGGELGPGMPIIMKVERANLFPVHVQLNLHQSILFSFAVPESPISGSKAILSRTDSGLGLYLQTTNLEPGTYTLWWIIYNSPEECNNESGASSMCDGGDMLNPKVSSVLRAGGDVVDESGALTMVSWLPVGSDPGNVMGSLTNPESAEVHNLLVWHGLPLLLGDGTDLSSLEMQIHDLQGGCEFYRVNGGMDPAPINVTLMGGPFELCPMLQGTYFAVPEVKAEGAIDEETGGDEGMDNGGEGEGLDQSEDDTSDGGSGRVLTAVGGLLSAVLRHGLYL